MNQVKKQQERQEHEINAFKIAVKGILTKHELVRAALRPFAGLPPCTPLPTLAFLQEMERRENANGQQFGQIRDPARRLHFQQDLPELQDHLI
jgi:hypothetical protein